MADDAGDRLRIAMISYYLPSGSKIGVGYQVHELATALTRRGHEVTVFSDCPAVEGAIYQHRHLGRGGRMRTFRFALRVRETDFSGFDVIHAHGDDYWLWRRRVRVHVRTVHGSCFEEALRIHGFKERLRMVALGLTETLASLVADATVVVSPRTAKWVPRVRAVIPNGVDFSRFHTGGERAAVPTVLFVGTWLQRKRGRELAAAFSRDVLPSLPDARLEMVCRDAPANPGRGISVLGSLSDEELADAYRRAWVFCLPSEYEGFGIPYAEAMASGVPVVATPNIGAQYVTDSGKAGRLVQMDGIGGAIRDLLGDVAAREQLAAAGLARAAEFDLDSVVNRYEELYRGRR